jgi:hypothetical protein
VRSALAASLVVMVVAVAPGSATALHSGPELRAYGHGETAIFLGLVNRFSFDSRLGPHEATDPLGEPHGEMHLKATDALGRLVAEVNADVTCLTVVGNRATIGGRVKRVRGEFSGRGVLFDVTDNTTPTGQPTADLFRSQTLPEPPQLCPAPTLAERAVVKGDIVVEQN